MVELTSKDHVYNVYSGNVIIPSEVLYNGETYSVVAIGEDAFSNCSALLSVEIPSSIRKINDYAFYECVKLSAIKIHKDITSIGKDMFFNCHALASLEVDSLNMNYCSENNVLYNKDKTVLIYCAKASQIFSFSLPLSVQEIKDYAFANCVNLDSLFIGNSIKTISNSAFSNCKNLVFVHIGDSVQKIGDYSFYRCKRLEKVIMGDNVKEIGHSAFMDCLNIKSLKLPRSLSYVNYSAFKGCNSLSVLNYEAKDCRFKGYDSDYDTPFKDMDSLQIVNIGNQVRLIPQLLFYGCKGLKEIILPSSLEEIGDMAFMNCGGIKFIKSWAKTPPKLYGKTFSGVGKDIRVEVVCSTKDIYDSLWTYFTAIEEKCIELSLSVNDELFGTVEGGGIFEEGSEVEIKATAKEGYVFEKWSDSEIENPRNVTLDKDTSITAIFVKESSLLELEKSKTIMLYPNPASTQLRIEAQGFDADKDIIIVDMQARIVLSQRIKDSCATINVETLASGVYFVRIGNYSSKLVVNH